MRSTTLRSHLAPLLLPLVLLAAGACKSSDTPEPTKEGVPTSITNEYTVSAQVVALAPSQRALSLRREDGTTIDVLVDPAVRNYDQIAVGDTLRVRYRESLSATKLPKGSTVKPAEATFAAARAEQGAKPGVGVGVTVSLRVRIESIDRERAVVVFSPASGELIARNLRTPEGRAFVEGLQVGDIVQLDYSEGLAMGVDKL
jgi:hypothetical protein